MFLVQGIVSFNFLYLFLSSMESLSSLFLEHELILVNITQWAFKEAWQHSWAEMSKN